MRSLASLVCVTLLLAVPASAVDSQVRRAMERCVSIQTEKTMGTGTVIETGLVLTNYHVIDDNTLIAVDGKPATIVVADPQADLALLKTETIQVKRLEFCFEHDPGDEVFYVGNPTHMKKFLGYGRINGTDAGMIYTDAAALPGFSGSALYCKKHGKCIGVYNQMYGVAQVGFPYSVAIPAKITRKFLGEH
jgi:S1-C subfamily serine protease